jgi:hypothetical protein
MPGTYEIGFFRTNHWNKPENQTINISTGNNIVVTGSYTSAPNRYVWYVDCSTSVTQAVHNGKSWQDAFVNIQEAVDAIDGADGGEIWVADGSYTSQNNHVVELKDNISLFGGFNGSESRLFERNSQDNKCIIDGEIQRRCIMGANNCSLDGFIIRNGYTTFTGGGGLLVQYDEMHVKNCIFENNFAGVYGGGGILYYMSSGSVYKSEFIQNNSSGLGNTHSPDIDVLNCIFRNNLGYGGGIYNRLSSVKIVNSLIFDNDGGLYGGAIYNNNSSPQIINCTITKNNASNGGAMVNEKSSPLIKNCVIWANNSNTVFYNYNQSQPTVTYTCIQGGHAGTGNKNTNPQFKDAANNDFTLQVISPCIDSGTASGAPSDDLIGVLRPQKNGIDMGAFELEFSPPIIWYIH